MVTDRFQYFNVLLLLLAHHLHAIVQEVMLPLPIRLSLMVDGDDTDEDISIWVMRTKVVTIIAVCVIIRD